MKYSADESMQYIKEEDVKFIRLAFCDIYGRQKNISVQPDRLRHVFESGIAVDATAIAGFGRGGSSDLLLHPDPSTISVLPWRPEHGRVVRMFCSVTDSSGVPFEADTRGILEAAAADAERAGVKFAIGTQIEFYLFKRDENGEPTDEPHDRAGYMDIAPEDKGEDVRREICLTIEKMGIKPESSHHEEGPGQNEIDFVSSSPLEAADNAVTFRTVVSTVAARNGLFASFSPKPLERYPGNGMHINISASLSDGKNVTPQAAAGIIEHISDMTLFFNPSRDSYRRLGSCKAPKYISWGREDRSNLIRLPSYPGCLSSAELRSPDPGCNPYLSFALLIRAGLDGIKKGLVLPSEATANMSGTTGENSNKYESLPATREEASCRARASKFIAECLPESIIASYCDQIIARM